MSSEVTPALRFPDMPKLELDDLIDQLIERAHGVQRAQGRLRGLLRAIETVTSDLALEQVLRNVVEAARDLAGAQYGALGVIGDDGGLEQFIPVGIDDDTAARIGHLIEGKGLLGAVITADPRPIRLEDMADDDRSASFPAEQPPMESFLGVPIKVRSEVYGNLYLANNANGRFSAEDEELVLALALAAGTAISNARLYQESRLQQRWLEASAEISAQLLVSAGEDPLQMIARRAIDIADADLVSLGLLTADRSSFVIEVAFGEHSEELVGRRFALAGTLAGQVVDDGTPVQVSSASDGDGPPSHLASVMECGPLMAVPLQGSGRPRGVLTLMRHRDRRNFSETDLVMAASFASHASIALELADSRAAEQKLVLLEDRDRIAMDLHDHVIQELFAIGLSLEGMAAQASDSTAERLRQRVDDLDRTIRRIRTSIFELRGNWTSTPGGMRQQVLEVASDLTAPLGFAPHVAFSGLVDFITEAKLAGDTTACIREMLSNVARHARATSTTIDVQRRGEELVITVTDDGIGPPVAPTRRSGTANLVARAEKHGGSFEMTTASSGGTIATWKARIT
jgi:two-component system, NarL family, sensor histidine kinase DevS